MDLTGRLLRFAARRPHVLVVAVPGGTGMRVAAEAELGRRGWPAAQSPAGADLLLVAGAPGPDLAAVVETLWSQLPAPRARVSVERDTDIAGALDAGQRELADATGQRRTPDAADGTAGPPHDAGATTGADGGPMAHGMAGGDGMAGGHEMAGGDGMAGGHEMAGGDGMAGGHEMAGGDGMAGGHEMAGGHGMHQGHGGMGGMEMPGGVPMADLGEDRDGLQLDALHVPLGPVLPDWPAGLVLRVVLQGDVIVGAEAEVLDGGTATSFWALPADGAAVADVARRAAAGHLDGLARFLGVAGWSDPATVARQVRDRLLAGDPAADVAAAARDLAARTARSRTLRWLVRGVPAGDRDVAARLADRLAALRAALELLDDPRPAAGVDLRALDGPAVAPAELAAALVGAEFAAARLVVAALGPVTAVREVLPHGHG